jgi:APA family basic amino acid/polyamine antiporter
VIPRAPRLFAGTGKCCDAPVTAGTNSFFRTKSVEQSIADTEEPEHALKKTLSALGLTVFGVGVIIGTGIFVLTGQVAKNNAGPAVALAFVVSGVVCGLAALCYAEFASTVPVAGSAYTFSFATLGELPAWIIGWDLILELALGCAVVSVGWSGSRIRRQSVG